MGHPRERSRREILAGLGIGAVAWTAPQVISMSRAGAATTYTITMDVNCARTDTGPAVPFTWSCDPDMTDGGTIVINTVGCAPTGGTGSGICFGSSPPNQPFTQVANSPIVGSSIVFPDRSDPEACFYQSFTISVMCSS